MRQHVLEELLKQLEEVAKAKPQSAHFFMNECMATLAMERFSNEEMTYFEQKAFAIFDAYIGETMFDEHIVRGDQLQ